MSDPLDPAALLSRLPRLLPTDAQTLNNQYEALAALLHSAMISLDFRLVALDDDSPAQETADGRLPLEWTKNGPSSFSFRYKHEQSSMVFYLKLVKMGNRVVVHGIALESDNTKTLDILASDYLSPSFYPHSLDQSSGAPLVHGFISSARITDLLSLYKINILSKLIPGLRKDGYEDTSMTTTSGPDRASAGGEQPRPAADPQPGRPFGFRQPDPDDPLRIPNIGRRDLDPIPRNPFSPPDLFVGDDDGMYVGPNHPIFRDRLGPRAGGIGGERMGPWGGDGFLPPMGAPPGARFDPIGPGPRGGGPLGGFPGPSRGGPFGGGGGFGGRGPMGEPDNDEFMPPGVDDMYS